MKRSRYSESSAGQGGFRPFENLDRLITRGSLPAGRQPKLRPIVATRESGVELADEELFKAAMADVKPLTEKNHGRRPVGPERAPVIRTEQGPDDSCQAMQALVRWGIGLCVEHTAEYIQGSGAPVDPSLFRKLRQGKFAIEAYIDLHGLTADQAGLRLEKFIEEALKSGKRSVLIVHGRGLSSPGPPVLKALVERFLTRGPYRRRLLAYTSSRQCDGGAGATQVLFRRRPLTAKQIRQARRSGHDPVDLPV